MNNELIRNLKLSSVYECNTVTVFIHYTIIVYTLYLIYLTVIKAIPNY